MIEIRITLLVRVAHNQNQTRLLLCYMSATIQGAQVESGRVREGGLIAFEPAGASKSGMSTFLSPGQATPHSLLLNKIEREDQHLALLQQK